MLVLSDVLRGYTDTILLAQLQAGDSYGYEINKNIQLATKGALELKEATLYTTFRRLESGGFIESYWGDEATGARRRYYRLTENGKALLIENRADWEQAKAMLDHLIQVKE